MEIENMKIKNAEAYLNYKEIGFFEQASINLLTVLLDKYGSMENIILERINVSNLILEEKYKILLDVFIEPIKKEAFEQLRDMIYDVKTLIIKYNYTLNQSDYNFLGIKTK